MMVGRLAHIAIKDIFAMPRVVEAFRDMLGGEMLKGDEKSR